MSEDGMLLFIVWCLSTLTCFINTKDIAAPIMFVCAALGVYHSQIFFIDYRFEIDFFYLLLCLVVALLSFVYFGKSSPSRDSNSRKKGLSELSSSKIDFTIWAFSIPAIAGQIYMIQMFGGFGGYIIAAKMGTKFFHGLGPLKSIIATYHPLFLVYAAVAINRVNTKSQLFLFLIHLVLFLLMAGLTLSRGTLLTQLVTLGLIYHFSIRKLSPLFVAGSLATLLACASIYGVLRESVSFEDGELSLNYGSACSDCYDDSADTHYRSEWMFAGLFPLTRVTDAPSIEKLYGQTYATAITNFIPRRIWPEKPDPGGVVLTKKYAQGFYDEYSHFATGLFAEAIINFGLFGGIIFGFCQLSISLLILSQIHFKYFLNRQGQFNSISSLKNLLIFISIIYSMGVMLIGEFTSIMIGLFIKIFMIFIVCKFLNLINQKPLKSYKRINQRVT